jgi:hypothetical protein
MERVRSLLGDCPIRITTAYKNPQVNALSGGSSTSDHMSGYSVDFTCERYGTPFEVAQRISQSPIMDDVDQIIFEFGRWVHISFAPTKRRQLITAHRTTSEQGPRTRFTAGILALDADGQLIEAPAANQ